ncbi:MAG: ABC transporter substrate-binding protein [Dehalococcoidia bacterium]|nr:ABC transporter substrate-binding protein [Dehalococcoidia bacterium]
MTLVTVLGLCAGCAGGSGGKGPVVVGSKIDTEGALLANAIILLLEDAGFDVVDKSHFGTTAIVRKAILSGEIDMYPEYTGSGEIFFEGTSPEVWRDAAAGYEAVRKLDLETNNIVWLTPAPANNTWAIAIPRTLADQEGLITLDDLAAYVNAGGAFKIACSEEFVTSPAALPAFQDAYGFELSEAQLLTLAGGNTAQTEQAAAQGTDDVNAAMAYGTDGSLSALDLVVLTDPRGVQPVYEPTPIVRGEIYEAYPEIGDILAPCFESLTLENLQELNARIALEGHDAADVARDYLTSKGFL